MKNINDEIPMQAYSNEKEAAPSTGNQIEVCSVSSSLEDSQPLFLKLTEIVPYKDYKTYKCGQLIAYEGSTFVVVAPSTSLNPSECPCHYKPVAFRGINGKNGRDGLNGADGLDGLNGSDGLNGLNGQDGIDGEDGKDGITLASVTPYVAGFPYPRDSVVYYNGSTYLVTAASTTGNPDEEPGQYELLAEAGADGTDGVGLDGILNYVPGTTYYQNQVVYYEGSSYIVTAAITTGSPDTVPSDYQLLALAGSSDMSLTGIVDYQDGATYTAGDTVYFEGSSYLVTAPATTGSPAAVPGQYQILASVGDNGLGLNGIVNYTAGIQYPQYTVVYYTGSSYLVTAPVTTGSPDEEPFQYQPIALEGANGEGLDGVVNYVIGTSYSLNDVVYFNGSTYLVTAPTTTGTPAEQPDQYQPIALRGATGVGLNGIMTYVPLETYYENQVVFYDGSTYIVTAVSTTATPSPTSPDYQLIAEAGTGNGAIITFSSAAETNITIPALTSASNLTFIGTYSALPSSIPYTTSFTPTVDILAQCSRIMPRDGVLASYAIFINIPSSANYTTNPTLYSALYHAPFSSNASSPFTLVPNSVIQLEEGSPLFPTDNLVLTQSNINETVDTGDLLLLAVYISYANASASAITQPLYVNASINIE